MNLLADGDGEAGVLLRTAPLAALAGGLGLGRAFLFVADAERAVLAGRFAVGPADAAEAARFPTAAEPDQFAARMESLTAADLEQAAPVLTDRVRGLALPLVPGVDPFVDLFLEGGCARYAEDGIDGAHGTPHELPAWASRLGLRAGSAATITSAGRPVALLVVDDRHQAVTHGDHEFELVAAFAEAAGQALDARRSHRGQVALAGQLATLDDLSRSVVGASNTRTELALIVRAGTQALQCRGGVLWRTGPERRSLVLETIHVTDDRVDPLRQAAALEPLARAAMRDRGARTLADAAADPLLDPSAVRGFGAVHVTPVGSAETLDGVLLFFGPSPVALDEPALFDRTATRVAGQIASLAAILLAHARVSDRLARAEAHLAEAQRQGSNSEKLAALGAIAARAAVEAQNPMASIGGFARRVHKSLEPGDPNREYLEIILRESERVERLLAEQMQFADLSRPRLAMENLNQVLATVLTNLSDGMVKRRVRLLKKLAPDVPPLLLDAEKIRQVVRNMIVHSLEHVPQGGRVRIESRRSQGYVVVEIASEAPPLTGEMLEQLFVPFAATRRSGDQVGLALAQQVVQSHGGEIRVRSEGDWGIIFSFTLPVADNADRRRSQDRRGVRMDRRNRFPAA